MKKLVSLLIVAVLVCSMVVPAMASTKATVKPLTGIVQNFTDETISLRVNGKVTNYKLSDNLMVEQAGGEADYMDVVKKGLTIQFKEAKGVINWMDVPVTGNAMIGRLERIYTKAGALMTTLLERRENTSDSSLLATDKNAVVVGKELDDAFQWKSNTVVNLGQLLITPGSMKVKLEGKELKVIEGTAAFNADVVGDEVRLVVNATEGAGFQTLVFEKAVNATNYDTLSAILEISFEKTMFSVVAEERTELTIDENAVVEFQGKPATIAKVLAEAGEVELLCDTAGDVVHISGYYNEYVCQVESIKNGKMTIFLTRGNKVYGRTTVELGDFIAIFDPFGREITTEDIYAKAHIKFSVDPYDDFRVLSITRLYY